MPRTRLDWKVVKDITGKLNREMHARASELVLETAQEIETGAKVRAPVDTGFLRSSIQSRRESELVGEAKVGAEYGAYVEYGTRHTAPRPFFTPAFESAKPEFYRKAAKILG